MSLSSIAEDDSENLFDAWMSDDGDNDRASEEMLPLVQQGGLEGSAEDNWYLDEDGDRFGDAFTSSEFTGSDASMDNPFSKDDNNKFHNSENLIRMDDGLMLEPDEDMPDADGLFLLEPDEEPPESIMLLEPELLDEGVGEALIIEPDDGYQKTIRFAESIATSFGEEGLGESESSLATFDFFDAEGENKASSCKSLGSNASGTDHDDEEEDEDKKIKRTILYAAGGVGLVALLGFGAQKLQQLFNRGGDEDEIEGGATNTANHLSSANDVASTASGDGGFSSAAMGTNASASQSQISMVGFGWGGGGGAAPMSAAQ
jgi:hypothetical protein